MYGSQCCRRRSHQTEERGGGSMTRVSRLALLLAVALGWLWPAGVAAQGQKGAIAGTVTDNTKAVLRGAQVSVEPQAVNVASDEQGQFFINDLNPGSYTVTITYVGFAKFEKMVDVGAGQRVTLDAQLEVQSQ